MSNEVQFKKPPKKKDPMYITIIVLLLAIGGLCGYQWMHYKGEAEKFQAKSTECGDYVKELESLLGSSGVSLESTDLKANLNQMLSEYDSLMVTGVEMTDSLLAQKERVQGLLTELESAKNSNSLNRRTIFKLRKETETLRGQLKLNYRRIDSLRAVTIEYEGTIGQQGNRIKEQDSKINMLDNENTELTDKVKAGSKLQATPPKAYTLRERGAGNFKETERANRTTLIKSCMTILGNRIAESGPRTIYMVVITPSGKVLTDGNSESFDAGGSQMSASIKRRIDYNREENLDLCIFYTVPESQDLEKGEYTIQMYAQGLKLGSTKFALK